MTEKYYAHSVEGKPTSEWQPLDEHLKNVAEKARSFAEAFGAGDWGCLAGLWHDIGKYSKEFQHWKENVIGWRGIRYETTDQF
jgi:CRISPR-associated endonuclease/helicase Cas3